LADKLPSDEIRDDDFRDPKDLDVDLKNIEEHLRRLHTNIYEYIIEVLQNGGDSGDEGEPNTVHAYDPGIEGVCLHVRDEGLGLSGDYGDINKFLAAKKGTSNKPNKKNKAGKLGLGMFDYVPNIAKYAIFTTMDKYLITRIPMGINPATGLVAWGLHESKPINEEFMRKFGIYKRGTLVSFINRDPDKPAINFYTLHKKASEVFPLILARNKNLRMKIQNKWVRIPASLVDHPEEKIQDTKYGRITGAIWFEEKGNGAIKVFVNGYYIETITFKPVKCLGYVNFDALDINRSRTAVIKDNNEFEKLREVLIKQLSRFPSVETEQEAPKNTKDLMYKALRDLIPLIPIKPGPTAGTIKEETKGIAGGTELGYITEHEEGVELEPGITRGPTINHGTVTDDPNGKIIRIAKRKQGKYTEQRALELLVREIDENKPLTIVYPEIRPLLIELNKLNAEYIPYVAEKTNKKTRWDLLVNSMAEIRIIIKRYSGLLPLDPYDSLDFENMRMQLSYERVVVLKALGLYPTVEIVKGIRGHGHSGD
jgi:hypothetical protein